MNKDFFQAIADPTSSIPCYFCDAKTHEILYFNEPMKRLMEISDDSYIGEKCYDIIHDRTKECATCPFVEGKIKQGEFTAYNFFCEKIQTHITSLITVFTYQGKVIEYNKFYEADDGYKPIEKLSFQSAVVKAIEILSYKNKKEIIEGFLELLGQYYKCDRSYFYVMDTRSDGAKYVFSWEKENAPAALAVATEAGHEQAYFDWVSAGSHLQILEIDIENDIVQKLSKDEVKIYQENEYRVMTVCPSFSSKGKLKAILGLLNKESKLKEGEQSLLKIVAQFLELSEHVSSMATGEEIEYIDHLTGVFNREKYNIIVQALKYEDAKDIGVAFINVNGLKKTNQYYGFEAGDQLIRDSIDEAKAAFPFDWYRLSGDEFVCFITEQGEEEFQSTLSSLHEKLAQMPQRLFALGSAWGNRASEIDRLVEHADAMMFIDKQTYYTDFDPSKIEFSDHVLQDLLLAIQEEEFLVYLQPKVELATESVIGAEALIRRFSKKLNRMVFPDQFIPLYEKKSIIRHVDLFVLRKVCLLLQGWNNVGKKLKVSVNLSRVTLLEHGIVHKFAEICDDYQISHDQIVVEVTERVGLIENEVESPLIEQFKHYGFTISLDDFGCAYSNIVTLATISVDEVKIDKSLVDNILTNHKNKSIVENMIRMVDSFGNTSTLAEGVETKEQADSLRECNCQYAQGYLYAKPMPSHEFFERYVQIL